MSETVHYKGKLTPVLICNGDLEATAKELYGTRPEPLPDYYDTYLEWLGEDSRDFYIADGAIYEVHYTTVTCSDEIMIASRNEDESIDFEVKYYNGGCGFFEALDESIKKIK